MKKIPLTDMQKYSGKNWVGKTYQVAGSWSVTENGPNRYFQLEDDFETVPGPDLKVYLIKNKMENIGNRDSIDKGGLYLGELISPTGKQEYEIPPELDLNDFQSIAIHCQKYSVVWGGVNLHE